jgi:replication factor C subunit 3/5
MNETTPWVEKYRPIQFDKIVLDNMNRRIFNNILERGYFPNLLFYGPPGTGKTTTIINLINEYQNRFYKISKSQIIHLNASDERGIDIVRNQINTFVKSNNLFETGVKFVILDEVDYMTKNAQQALKYLLQSCNKNVKFCLICNYICKVDESLQNEFINIRFNQLPRDEIYKFINNLSENENLNLTKDIIVSIQNIYQSDIRSIINFIQLNQGLNFEEWKNSVLNNSVYENIHKYILNKETTIQEIHIYLHETSLKYNTDKKTILQFYFDYLIRNKNELINRDFLNIIKSVTHCDYIANEEIIDYLCYYLRDHYL